MNTSNLTASIDRHIAHLLQAHEVQLWQPRERMLQLNSVPLGINFSKRCSNALIRQRPGTTCWIGYVDEDLTYLGNNTARQALFAGPRRKGWLELSPPEPISGDVNRGIVWLLEQLESPLRHLAPRELDLAGKLCANLPAADSDPPSLTEMNRVQSDLMASPVLSRVGRPLDLRQLLPPGFAATWRQSDIALRTAETVTRDWAPRCPLIVGPAGSGRSSIARLAADMLVRQGCVDQAWQLTGAAIASGAIFWPERDERLRQTLTALEQADPRRQVLVIVEQFDLTLIQSEVAAGLLADALDAGLRLVAVARPGFALKALRGAAQLRRRMEPIEVCAMSAEETLAIVRQRWTTHPLFSQLELAADLPRLIVSLAEQRPGVAPGAALGLLDAVVRRAALVGQSHIGPDDLYHLVSLS